MLWILLFLPVHTLTEQGLEHRSTLFFSVLQSLVTDKEPKWLIQSTSQQPRKVLYVPPQPMLCPQICPWCVGEHGEGRGLEVSLERWSRNYLQLMTLEPSSVPFRTQGRTLMLSIWKRPCFVPNGLKIVKYISPPQTRYTVCQQACCGWGWSLPVALFFMLEQKFLSCSFDIIINIPRQFSWLSIKSVQLRHWSFLSWVNVFGDFVSFCF